MLDFDNADRRELERAVDLRKAMTAFARSAGRRRVLPTSVHLGSLGGRHTTVPHDDGLDAAMRADIVERLLDRIEPGAPDEPQVWVTRCGRLAIGDADIAWFAAARTGFGRHGLPFPGVVVMTREGWLDVGSGQVVLWRPRRSRQRNLT
ncbi:MAG: hypothetical protein JWP74_2403 [Marmoricola sp.]|nr:hypothetical protein [Marmoricola sp.]